MKKVVADKEFRMNPLMAETVAQYIQTLINNLESDIRMQNFLSQDELDVLNEARSIAEDVADALKHPGQWGIG